MLFWATVAAASLLRGPCRPCTALLEGADAGPCGCGFGLVRKSHTRDELTAMSQVELDKLLRDSEDELDELKGALEAAKKDHAEKLKEMNETTKGMQDELWKETGTNKAGYMTLKGNYSAEAEEVAKMEEDLKIAADNVTNLKITFGDLQEELGYQLSALNGCPDCHKQDVLLLAAKAESLFADRPEASGRALLDSHLALLRQNAVAEDEPLKESPRAKKLKTVLPIEKLEMQLVKVVEETQEDQAAYDTAMRAFIASQDKMKLNHTTVTSRQEREADSLDVRVASQEKAKEALVKIVASKQEQAENIALRLHAAETQVKGLKKLLNKCNCAI
jgi:chromosome segregation ATPase